MLSMGGSCCVRLIVLCHILMAAMILILFSMVHSLMLLMSFVLFLICCGMIHVLMISMQHTFSFHLRIHDGVHIHALHGHLHPHIVQIAVHLHHVVHHFHPFEILQFGKWSNQLFYS